MELLEKKKTNLKRKIYWMGLMPIGYSRRISALEDMTIEKYPKWRMEREILKHNEHLSGSVVEIQWV